MKIASVWAIAGLLAAVTLPGLAIEPKPSCDSLDGWAAQLPQLPADYESFSALPVANRKAVYRKLSDSQRATLWQRQWREVLKAGSWSEDQKALITEAGRLTIPETFASLRKGEGASFDAASAAIRDFGDRAVAAFSKTEAIRLFSLLGPPPAGTISGAAVMTCWCNLAAQDCWDPSWTCKWFGYPCMPTVEGCGSFWTESCDGRCY